MAEKKVKIPENGINREEILRELEDIHKGDANWKEGRTWSLVYYAGEEHNEFLKKVYNTFFSENGLNPMAFPSLKRFEAEVLSMSADMLGGDDRVVGAMTTGGTESILMAVKTYREWGKAKKKIEKPEMVLPISAHPAFEKAAHYFSVKPVHYAVGEDYRADVAAARECINENTVLLVGSAPSYPHGVVDPIPELAALALEKEIGMHVDSCLGGYLLPFVKKLGYPIPDYDFRAPGVTSISADVHKYGFAAKGASVVLYKNAALRRHQFFVYPDWPGGLYGSPSMTGTRPGGSIAAAWAALRAFGVDGYMKNAEKIMNITIKLRDGVAAVPGVKIIGKPDMSVFAFTTDEVDVFAVADELEKRGWHIDRQQSPNCLHVMVTLAHEHISDQFVSDLKSSVEYLKENPTAAKQGSAPMYGMMATIPDRGMVKEFALEFLDSLYTV